MPRQEKLQTYTGDLTALIHELVFLREVGGLYTKDQVENSREKWGCLSQKIHLITHPNDLLELYQLQNINIRKSNGAIYIKNKSLRRLYHRVNTSFSIEKNQGEFLGLKRIGNKKFIIICVFDKTQDTLEHELNHFLDDIILEIDKISQYIKLDTKKRKLLSQQIKNANSIKNAENKIFVFSLMISAIYLYILNLYKIIDETFANKKETHIFIILFFLILSFRQNYIDKKISQKISLLQIEYKDEYKKYSQQTQEVYAEKYVGQPINSIRFQ